MNISKDQYISALQAPGVLNQRRIVVLKALYENAFSKATSKQIAERVGEKIGTINLRFGRFGRLIAEHLNIRPEKWKSGSYQWFSVLAETAKEPNGINWILKSNLTEALLELGVLSEAKYYPDEVDFTNSDLSEGMLKKVYVNSYERNTIAREKCIEYYGLNCKVCNISFEKIYGEIGKGFIHVHHINMISQKGGKKYQIDHINDLIPVCPNCHAMIHRRVQPYCIAELKEMIHFQFE